MSLRFFYLPGLGESAGLPWSAKRLPLVLALLALAALPPSASAGALCSNGATTATSWMRWDCALDVQGIGAALAGRNPYLMKLKVTYTAAGQPARYGYAFWDGLVPGSASTHRFRMRMQFPPTASPTTWTWTTTCESPDFCSADTSKTSPSLVSSGTVTVSSYTGGNPLYQGGPIRIRTNMLYPLPELYQGNNRFIWIGDSAWAAPMRATAAEWDTYLENRRSATDPTGPNSANVRILHIGPASSWAGFVKDPKHPEIVVDVASLRPFDTLTGCTSTQIMPNGCSTPNLAYWRSFEDKIEKANQKGLYLFLAGLMEPYMKYPATDEAERFACWLVARLSGNFVIFSPGFDSPPVGNNQTPLIKAVGAAIKKTAPQHLVTNHWSTPGLGGTDSVQQTADQMATVHNEPWLDFELYQSGFMEGSSTEITKRARQLAQVLAGHTLYPPFNATRKPVVNGEAIYDEGGNSANGRPEFRAYRARQAGYLSWLSGSIGYTHGSGGLWDWGACGGAAFTLNPCKDHGAAYLMPPGYRTYSDAMKPIGQAFKNVKYLGEAIRRSATDAIITYEQSRILNQADTEEKKMVVARHRDWMIAYLPHNEKIELNYAITGTTAVMNPATARLWNPADGTFETNNPSRSCSQAGTCIWTNFRYNSGNPDISDRLLVLTPGSTNTWFQSNANQLEAVVGRFVEGEPLGLYGQLLDPNGSPTGAPFLIHRLAGQEPASPAVGRDGDGKFLVVWSADTDGDSLAEVWGKWVDSGTSRLPSAFQISPSDGSEHLEPSVGISGDGTALVAWTRARWPIHGKEIWARSVKGDALGEPEAVCEGEGKACSGSKVAASLTGQVTVGWIESEEALGQERVMLRAFASGNLRLPTTYAQQVNEVEAPNFWLHHLHIDADGNVRAEYEGLREGSSAGFYTRSFDGVGNRVGSEVQLAPAYVDQ